MLQFSEKRSESRELHKSPILVQEFDDVYIYNARMTNFNFKGAYFESDTDLKVGTQIIIGIEDSTHISPNASQDSPNFYNGKVMWKTESNSSFFKFGYGTKFVYYRSNKNSLKAESILKEEYRKHPRKRYSAPVFIFSIDKYIKGSISNISRGGAYIKTTGNFKAGQTITFVLPKTKTNKSIMINSEVLHLTLDGVGVGFKKITVKPLLKEN